KDEFDYPITLPPWMETGRTCRACVMATGVITEPDGSRHEVTFSSVEQNTQVIAVVEPERLNLLLDRPSVRAGAGQMVEVPFRIARGKDLAGAAKVELIGAGHGILTADPVTVAAAEDAGQLRIRVPSEFKSHGTRALTLRATLVDNGLPV